MTNAFAGAGQQGAVRINAAPRPGTAPAPRRLDFSIDHAGSGTRLCLRGTLDTTTAAAAYDEIIAAAAVPGRQMRLDLSGLDAATRAGCRAIFVAARLLHFHGGRTTVYGARPNVAAVLKNAGFDAVLEFHDGAAPPVSPEAALTGPVHGRVFEHA